MAAVRKPRRKPCPYCGSRDTSRIVWGLSVPDPDRPLPDDVLLGGCCVEPGCPERQCNTCGRRFDYLDPSVLEELEG
jgi:DNA-directed RNA polymerase subunit RPC12/RpoP